MHVPRTQSLRSLGLAAPAGDALTDLIVGHKASVDGAGRELDAPKTSAAPMPNVTPTAPSSNALAPAASGGPAALSQADQVLAERVWNLFRDPAMTLRFSFELDPDLCPPGTAAGGSDGGRLSAIPFFRQGDKLTVKPGEKDKRYKMINDRGVKRALDRFWDTFKYKDVQYGVNREQYVDFHLLVSRTLRTDVSEVEAQGIAARDWMRDCSSNHGMLQDAWRHSMFELADLWEIGDDAGAYTAFLEILFTRVAEPASQSAIRKAISTRHPKPADLANDAQLIRWAIDHVDFRYRALSNVPRAEMGSNGRTMRINANGTRTLTTTVAPKRNSNADLETFENFAKMEVGVSSLQTGGDQGRNKTQSRALTRLEAFLADDMEYAMGEFTETDDIIASAGAASERFAQVMQQARTATSMSVLDITFADSGTTAPKANLVRATFEESATGRRQRADDAVNLPADVADSVNRVTWEILADTGFVDVVAGNGMLVRVRQVWNDADADPTS